MRPAQRQYLLLPVLANHTPLTLAKQRVYTQLFNAPASCFWQFQRLQASASHEQRKCYIYICCLLII